jgi:hypothetical protein
LESVEDIYPSKCDWPYPYLPLPAHCYNGIEDGNETGVDCGGSCNDCTLQIPIPVPPSGGCNNNGIQDNGETGVDCGGLICPPCFSGPPPPNDHCDDGIQNFDETGVDCGGLCLPCFIDFPACENGIQDGTETGVDCGGDCVPCSEDNEVVDDLNETTMYYMESVLNTVGVSLANNNIGIQSDLQYHESLLDNGNTLGLIEYISDNATFSPKAVLNVLYEASPNVSVRALHTVLENSQLFTRAEFLGLIKMNAGVLQDPYILSVIQNQELYTSEDLASVFEHHRTVSNERISSLSNIQMKKQLLHHILRERIDVHLAKSNPDWNEIRHLLSLKDERNAWYQIYETYISESKYTLATAYLNSINIEEETDPFFKERLNKFKYLNHLLMMNYYAGNRKENLSANVSSALSGIANGCYGVASMKARSILLNYGIIVDFIDCNKYDSVVFKDDLLTVGKRESAFEDKISVFPNPTSSSIKIDIRDFDESYKYTYRLMDITGKVIRDEFLISKVSEVTLSTINEGVYFMSIYKDDTLFAKERIVKIK